MIKSDNKHAMKRNYTNIMKQDRVNPRNLICRFVVFEKLHGKFPDSFVSSLIVPTDEPTNQQTNKQIRKHNRLGLSDYQR